MHAIPPSGGLLNSELELHEFDIHRQDGTVQKNPSRRVGGVMICRKEQFKAVPILLDYVQWEFVMSEVVQIIQQ